MKNQKIVISKLQYILCVAIMIGILLCFSTKAEASGIDSGAITVKFDSNGGDSEVSDMLAFYGDTYGPLPEVIRQNYDFIGWYTFASGGTKVTETTKVIMPLDHTLYARWRGVETEIKLEADGGTLATTTVKVYYGSKFSNQLPVPIKKGYKFVGWYTSLTGGDKITVKSIFSEKSPTTVYARWTEKSVKVIFIAFNGEEYDKEVMNGLAFGDLPEPEKENYLFGGWYKFRDYTKHDVEPITADTIVNEVGQIRLFARWYMDNAAAD